MKNIFILLLILLPSIGFSQKVTFEDTICIPMSVSAKLIDSMLYLKQYERYSLDCDKLNTELSNRLVNLEYGFTLMRDQKNIAERQYAECSLELLSERTVSKNWMKLAEDRDLEIQKIKRKQANQRKIIFVVGGVIVAGLTSGIVLAKIL